MVDFSTSGSTKRTKRAHSIFERAKREEGKKNQPKPLIWKTQRQTTTTRRCSDVGMRGGRWGKGEGVGKGRVGD